MWRHGAVWLLDKLISRLSTREEGMQERDSVRGELRKVLGRVRVLCQPPIRAPLAMPQAPHADAHILHKIRHWITLPFHYTYHFFKSLPGWSIGLVLAVLPALVALGYIHYLNSAPATKNVEDAFRHQEGRPLARILFIEEWPSSEGVARLLGAILRTSLNTEVIYKPLSQDRFSDMIRLLADNQADIAVSVWLPDTHGGMLEERKAAVRDLGPYLQGARMGLAVTDNSPAHSIAQLQAKDYGGVIFGIDSESGLNRRIRAAMDDYALESFRLVEKNDRYRLDELKKGLAEKRNVVFAAWLPDVIFGEYPVRMLDDPLGSFGDGEEIHLVLDESFATSFPRLRQCLERFRLTPQQLSDLLAQINKEKVPGEAVLEWITQNRLAVSRWIEPMLR